MDRITKVWLASVHRSLPESGSIGADVDEVATRTATERRLQGLPAKVVDEEARLKLARIIRNAEPVKPAATVTAA